MTSSMSVCMLAWLPLSLWHTQRTVQSNYSHIGIHRPWQATCVCERESVFCVSLRQTLKVSVSGCVCLPGIRQTVTPHACYEVQTQSLVSRYGLALTVAELWPHCLTTRADIFIRLARSPALSPSLSLSPALNPIPPPSQPLTSPAARQSNLGHPAQARPP